MALYLTTFPVCGGGAVRSWYPVKGMPRTSSWPKNGRLTTVPECRATARGGNCYGGVI
jgi:hypothetical protein